MQAGGQRFDSAHLHQWLNREEPIEKRRWPILAACTAKLRDQKERAQIDQMLAFDRNAERNGLIAQQVRAHA